ncbi:MAG TPA: hypothetical protein VFB21_10515, partial [Chthonomonadaceae bacterium]|nr:hypothetical protein [Chthonomonadaceae bacterium]
MSRSSKAEPPAPAGKAQSIPVAKAVFPRIAMLWSPAAGQGEKWANWAKHGLIVTGVTGLGLQWAAQPHKDMAETLVPESIPAAREALEQIRKRNPQAVVLYEIYFFEADTDAYPPDSPWWFRDKDGHKVQFWKGCYNMDVSNPEYIGHIVRRIEAVYRALDGKAGVFLDNLRYDKQAKAGWTLLLRQVRERCGDIPILVNAGWDSDDLRWVAPWINGILYEDSVAHT